MTGKSKKELTLIKNDNKIQERTVQKNMNRAVQKNDFTMVKNEKVNPVRNNDNPVFDKIRKTQENQLQDVFKKDKDFVLTRISNAIDQGKRSVILTNEQINVSNRLAEYFENNGCDTFIRVTEANVELQVSW